MRFKTGIITPSSFSGRIDHFGIMLLPLVLDIVFDSILSSSSFLTDEMLALDDLDLFLVFFFFGCSISIRVSCIGTIVLEFSIYPVTSVAALSYVIKPKFMIQNALAIRII